MCYMCFWLRDMGKLRETEGKLRQQQQKPKQNQSSCDVSSPLAIWLVTVG